MPLDDGCEHSIVVADDVDNGVTWSSDTHHHHDNKKINVVDEDNVSSQAMIGWHKSH